MIKPLLFLAFLSSNCAHAFEFPPIPSLKEQYENAKLDEVIEYFETDPFYAGKTVTIDMFGRRIPVDRTTQAPNPNAPTPSLGRLDGILNGLDAGVRGEVDIRVRREWHDNGLIKSEDWHITLGAGATITKEAKLEPEKKTTGAEQTQ
jgi:hypothetical protein